MILGTLRTRIVEKHEPGLPTEGGFFAVDVSVNESILQKSGDVKGYANTIIASYLANAVRDSTVPTEFWTFEASERAIRRYKLPPFLNFGVSG